MRFCGYDVFTEWIINDAGAQIERLARSIYARYRQVDDPTFPFPTMGIPASTSSRSRAQFAIATAIAGSPPPSRSG